MAVNGNYVKVKSSTNHNVLDWSTLLEISQLLVSYVYGNYGIADVLSDALAKFMYIICPLPLMEIPQWMAAALRYVAG